MDILFLARYYDTHSGSGTCPKSSRQPLPEVQDDLVLRGTQLAVSQLHSPIHNDAAAATTATETVSSFPSVGKNLSQQTIYPQRRAADDAVTATYRIRRCNSEIGVGDH